MAICDEGSASIDISVQARSVAHAIAEAFAQVVAQCETQGQAEARAQAYAMAQDHAEAIATAISGIWAGITTCGNCEAVVDSYARVSQFLVADAVAEAWTDVRPRRGPAAHTAAHTASAADGVAAKQCRCTCLCRSALPAAAFALMCSGCFSVILSVAHHEADILESSVPRCADLRLLRPRRRPRHGGEHHHEPHPRRAHL